MRNSADRIGGVVYDANGHNDDYGFGRVNARRAVLLAAASVEGAVQENDIVLVRQTAGWASMPVAKANGDGTWTITNGAAPSFIPDWAHQPGVRIVRAEPGYESPIGSAGRLAAWAASARSARVAAEQAVGSEDGSDFLREPHPTREQLFGRTGVDRLGGAGQPRLPGGHPFGVAG